MFRFLMFAAVILAIPLALMAQCNGNCHAVQFESKAYQWKAGATANERALYCDNAQVGAVWLPTGVYRPYVDGKFGEPCKAPTALPQDRKGLLGRLLELTNQDRSRNRAMPLAPCDVLNASAQANAEERARRGERSHILGFAGGENCGWGQRSAEEIVGDWIWSSGHHSTMIDQRYKRVGFGVATGADGREYWTAQYQ